MMRFISVIFMTLALVLPANAQGNLSTFWDEANTAYINADYGKAIAIYDSIASQGYAGAKLYYNLGNAYFKEGKIGKSILNYNRALRYDPSDADIRHNLKVANTYVKDKIEAVPEFFLKGWVRKWKQGMSSNAWAGISLFMFALSLGAVLFYLLSNRILLRKTGFYTAICALLLGAISLSFAGSLKRQMTNSSEAVVMSTAAAVKSSPDNSSKDIFILHEGTKVRILSTLNQWVEITIADGKKGWMHETAVETI